ncbi:ABC transporter permease [Labrys monachus]|uniref:Peptide/nickel transport system permease protein n=1 Tax=Labrys monachus TaxID=217067 RepID=A0ABU0FEK5_9HYPH|nr:ABC transporter permease [Labrys monachus]MDQ0392961.1 peptide/nickel transport system permease protein [Labrys monachus]
MSAIEHRSKGAVPLLPAIFRRLGRSKAGLFGSAIVLFWIAIAVFAPLIAPYPPNDLVGPATQGPTAQFWLGTDDLGRDVLSRLVCGTRSVLVLAPIAVLLAEAVGAAIGLASGYLGGVFDQVVMRLNDALIAFPTILLYLLIIAALGPSRVNVVLAIAAASVPGIARIVRGVVVGLRSRGFILSAQMRGERLWYVLLVELLPNARRPLLVDTLLRLGYATFSIGTLGFLGLGAPPPDPDWGGMVNSGVRWLSVSAWMTAVPALALASLVIGINLIAEAFEERAPR